MLERDSGHILNVASVTGFLPGPLMSVYFATKHYVLAFSESLIEELRGSGVRVTVLCPPVKTRFVKMARIASGNYMATTRTTPAEVRRYGYRMMKQGKAIAVYSVRYRFLTSVLVHIVPRVGLRWLLHRLNAQGAASLA
jgi:short-subunit dehydrogenase